MFKKPFKLQNAHSVSGKDKKKLKERLSIYGPELINSFMDDKDELQVIKVVGSKVVLYQKATSPLFFGLDGDKPTS
jgi:predicted ribosome-associated RNA-binding protein Tma20